MIFKPISDLPNRKDKSSLLEKVQLYVRLVQVFAQKEAIGITNDIISASTIIQIKEIGLIASETDLVVLKKELGGKLYKNFICSVNLSILYNREIGDLLDKLNNEKRKELQERSKKNDKLNLVDFFCGAGGLSLGFIQEGFNVRLANDNEDVCAETYIYNHPELPSSSFINEDIRTVIDNIENYIDTDVDVIVGGPPCQGFSSANQQRIIDDPRNELYKYFIKAIEKIAPKFVVMENVRGMLPYAEQVVDDYKKINSNKFTYNAGYKLLSSDDFSVAQKRLRLVYIAIRNDIQEKYQITPDNIFEDIDNLCNTRTQFALKDALEYIKPLEANREKNTNDLDSDTTGKKVDLNQYNGDENDYLRIINEDRKIPFVFNHKARYVNDINYEIYRRLAQGEDATNEKVADIMPYSHRNHIFKDKYFKLIADRPSRTITAHLRMDCHSHIHPYQVRSITPREAARIQSFPDDYLFLGAYLKTYMQIGNAVPPLMARGIAKIIKRYLT